MPASKDTFLLFVAHLHRECHSHATVNVYLSAILRSMHIMSGHVDLVPHYLRLKLAARAVGLTCKPPKQKLPLTIDSLQKIQSCVTEAYNHKMLRAALALGHFDLLSSADLR